MIVLIVFIIGVISGIAFDRKVVPMLKDKIRAMLG